MWWFSAMSSNRNREEFGPVTRNRSSSANEASKPILVLQRRQTHTGNKPLNFSPSNASNDGKSSLHLFHCFYTFAFYSFISRKQNPNVTFYIPPKIFEHIYNSPVKVKVTKIEKNRKKKKKKTRKQTNSYKTRHAHIQLAKNLFNFSPISINSFEIFVRYHFCVVFNLMAVFPPFQW